MRIIRPSTFVFVLLAYCFLSSSAEAQVIGTFRWQFQPYCNVVTFMVEQRGGAYLLTGSDNQCGGAPSPALGTAILNPDGTVGLGLSVVSPTASISTIKATVSLTSFSGVWRDQDGQSGALVFSPGTVGNVPPRPAPRVQITSGQIAAGAVTSDKLAPSVFAGSGAASTAARSDHLHDDRYPTRAEAVAGFLPRSTLGRVGYVGQAFVGSNGAIAAQHTSNGQAITVTKGSAGVYVMQFSGMGNSATLDQMVSITPGSVTVGTGLRICGVNSRQFTPATGVFSVTVLCFNGSSAATDASFFITVTG